MNELPDLADPRLYGDVIERMAEHPERYDADRISIGRLRDRQNDISKLLARTVAAGSYELGPVRERRALISGKERLLYSASVVDTIVLTALAQVLTVVCEPRLSSRVFSYRRGRSASALLAEFADYVTEHRRGEHDPRRRGLYVLRADVAAYGQSIPVERKSPLWTELRPLLERAGYSAHVGLFERAIRPVVRGLDGHEGERNVGVPTGSPVQPPLCNLYLVHVDETLAALPGAFYGRFGDDLILAHPDARVVQHAAQTLDELLQGLGLRVSEAKRQTWLFTGAARASTIWPEARPTQFVEYLGTRVDFAGQIGLTHGKFSRLLKSLRSRLANSDALLGESDPAARLQVLCSVINAALDPRSTTADREATTLHEAVTDANQLAELDYLLALDIAQRLSRRLGPRAFRSVPYRKLRQAGLWSALHARNTRGRP